MKKDGIILNVFKKMLQQTQGGTAEIKTLLQEERYFFSWNAPATFEEISRFESKHGYDLPKDYKDFLRVSNGAILFKSEYEDDGYRVLGLPDIEEFTQELISFGYDIPKGYYCFIQCQFSPDILLLDLNKEQKYIVDGDFGYPPSQWKHLSCDLKTFFIQLCLCNGATYWRW